MDDEQFAQFADITGATQEQAEVYLRFSEGNLEQAIQLFFESPDLANQPRIPQFSEVPLSRRVRPYLALTPPSYA